jgi:hypothetical protein
LVEPPGKLKEKGDSEPWLEKIIAPKIFTNFTSSKINGLILISIFLLTLFTRFAMVRDLSAPAWVDPIHHALITRQMMESGGLPETYEPYLPPEANYYHFGFHTSLSTFLWFTGLDLPDGMLIFGQVLNSLIVFTVYLLTKTLTKNHIAALSASLIAGTFTLMPAYYTSWGRYTHLAGILVLPVCVKLIDEISLRRGRNKSSKILFIIAGITTAGSFLIHYRVTAFLGFLVIAYILFQIKPQNWLLTVQMLLIIALIASFFLLPWLPGTMTNLILPKGIAWRGGAASFSQIPWNFLKPALGTTALVLAGFGLVMGAILRTRLILTIMLWTGLMYLSANSNMFGFPFYINPVSMEITLFIPIAILGGFAVAGTIALLDRIIPDQWHLLSRLFFLLTGILAGFLGAQSLIPTLNPITFLAREADFPAIEWLDQNIPEGETILINPAGWGYGLYMGHDGGYWISPLSGRITLPPPVLYGLGDPQSIMHINANIEQTLHIGEDAKDIAAFMQSENIQFLYIGARGGIISPQRLVNSMLFSSIYHLDGAWVFLLNEFDPAENIPIESQ